MGFGRGVRYGLLLSLPLWALLVAAGVMLAGCARDDGMGDLWKGVHYVEGQRP